MTTKKAQHTAEELIHGKSEAKERARMTKQAEAQFDAMVNGEVQHTPGPWMVENEALRGWEHRVTAATLGNMAMRLTVADIPNGYNLSMADPEIAANARLIAAAPDLLEAAQEALALIKALKDKYEGGRGVWAGEEALSLAIDRARGQ